MQFTTVFNLENYGFFLNVSLHSQEEDDVTVMNVRVEELMSAGSGDVVHFEQLTIVVGRYCATKGKSLWCASFFFFFVCFSSSK